MKPWDFSGYSSSHKYLQQQIARIKKWISNISCLSILFFWAFLSQNSHLHSTLFCCCWTLASQTFGYEYLSYPFLYFLFLDFYQVLQAPGSPRTGARSRTFTSRRQSALSGAAVRQRYGMSENTYNSYRAASAERRASVFGDANALAKLKQKVSSGIQSASTGVKTATETGTKICFSKFSMLKWIFFHFEAT